MKHALLPLSVLGFVQLSAQPTIEYAELGLMNVTFPISVVTDPGSGNPFTEGEGLTWDFSDATINLAGSVLFTSPANTPFGASYPTANLAQAVTIPSGTTYNYFNLTSAQLDMLAEDVGGSDPTIYTEPNTPMSFPFSYGDSFIDNFTYGGTDYAVTRTATGDGTVILPDATYTEVVKMTSSSGAIDFFRTNPVQPLLQITDDGTVLVWGDGILANVPTNAQPELLVRMDAAGNATIQGLRGGTSWMVHDVQGRMLQGGVTGNNVLELDLGSLAEGVYRITVEDQGGGRSVSVVR